MLNSIFAIASLTRDSLRVLSAYILAMTRFSTLCCLTSHRHVAQNDMRLAGQTWASQLSASPPYNRAIARKPNEVHEHAGRRKRPRDASQDRDAGGHTPRRREAHPRAMHLSRGEGVLVECAADALGGVEAGALRSVRRCGAEARCVVRRVLRIPRLIHLISPLQNCCCLEQGRQ